MLLTTFGGEALSGGEGDREREMCEEGVVATLGVAGMRGTHWSPW